MVLNHYLHCQADLDLSGFNLLCEHIRKDCNSYFESCYRNLEDRTKKKLDYFKPYVVGKINIVAITDATVHDGDKKFYRSVLLKEAV